MAVSFSSIKIGDLIMFKSAAYPSYHAPTKRVIGFDGIGQPVVRCAKRTDVIVLHHEIIEVMEASYV